MCEVHLGLRRDAGGPHLGGLEHSGYGGYFPHGGSMSGGKMGRFPGKMGTPEGSY